jgi:hypothetical protein
MTAILFFVLGFLEASSKTFQKKGNLAQFLREAKSKLKFSKVEGKDIYSAHPANCIRFTEKEFPNNWEYYWSCCLTKSKYSMVHASKKSRIVRTSTCQGY